MHILAKNNHVGEHSRELDSPLYTINTIDKIPLEIKLSQSKIEAINSRKISDTGNSACSLTITNRT